MLTKEACERALQNLRSLERKDNFKKWGGQVAPQISCDVIDQLIKEHFELEQNFKILEKNYDDIYDIVHCPEPYKFEDFRIGLWVYDIQPECEEFTFFKITKILSESDCDYLYHDKNKKVFIDNMTGHAREFEEDRFFPVTKA